MTQHDMKLLLVILTLLFFCVNVAVEFARRKTLNPLEQPLSAYLTGPYGWLQSAAYLGFSVALFLTTALYNSPTREALAFLIGGLALWPVVLTKWVELEPWAQKYEGALEHVHIFSAGVAFLGCTLGILWHNAGTPLETLVALPVGILLCIVFFWHNIEPLIVRLFGVIPDQSTIEEKAYFVPLVAAYLITVLS